MRMEAVKLQTNLDDLISRKYRFRLDGVRYRLKRKFRSRQFWFLSFKTPRGVKVKLKFNPNELVEINVAGFTWVRTITKGWYMHGGRGLPEVPTTRVKRLVVTTVRAVDEHLSMILQDETALREMFRQWAENEEAWQIDLKQKRFRRVMQQLSQERA